MDSNAFRDIILNVNYPVKISGCQIDWSPLKEPLDVWLEQIHSVNPSPTFEVAPKKHGNSPQFERFWKIDPSINFANFLTSQTPDQWVSYSYKALRDLHRGRSEDVPLNLSFCGFPEISEEITCWLGSPGAHTSCHYDTYGRNVVVQTHGRKRWILFSPETEGMQPTRIPYEESSVYSKRSLFSPKDATQNEDIATQAYVEELTPGDVLIVPPKWWHYVEALENSLSFNAWIPIEEDTVSRVDEYLVLHQLWNNLPKDLTSEQKKILLNPNSLDELENDPPTLDLLEVLIQDTKASNEGPPAKKLRQQYQCEYLTQDQIISLLEKNSQFVQKVEKNPNNFHDIMTQNCSRFCPKTEDIIQTTYAESKLRTLVSLINSLCAPSTIANARKILLESQ